MKTISPTKNNFFCIIPIFSSSQSTNRERNEEHRTNPTDYREHDDKRNASSSSAWRSREKEYRDRGNTKALIDITSVSTDFLIRCFFSR